MPTQPGNPGALSRADNATYVCPECGTDEGRRAFSGDGIQPVTDWPVRLTYRILREVEGN